MQQVLLQNIRNTDADNRSPLAQLWFGIRSNKCGVAFKI